MMLWLIAMFHILHIVRYSLRKLSVDIANAVLKICGHFSMSKNRRETFKDFNSVADTELPQILRYVSARWLSLLRCIESTLHTWKALCSHFKHTHLLLQTIG